MNEKQSPIRLHSHMAAMLALEQAIGQRIEHLVKSQALLPPTIIKLAGYCVPFTLVTGLASCPFVVVGASASSRIDVACWLVFVASFAR
jgi:hypothetical protein